MESPDFDPKLGNEIPPLTKIALTPIKPAEANPIHTDEYARQLGMRGALVGGLMLLSYILEMLYSFFGVKWFYYGKINVSFIGGGAINGDSVIAHGTLISFEQESDGTRLYLDVWMENQAGEKIVVGKASCVK